MPETEIVMPVEAPEMGDKKKVADPNNKGKNRKPRCLPAPYVDPRGVAALLLQARHFLLSRARHLQTAPGEMRARPCAARSCRAGCWGVRSARVEVMSLRHVVAVRNEFACACPCAMPTPP